MITMSDTEMSDDTYGSGYKRVSGSLMLCVDC